MSDEKKISKDGLDIRLLAVGDIQANNYNPNDMEAEMFETLVDHIKEAGVVSQPILVRASGDVYEIVDGEHRYQAAISAGLDEIVAVIVDYDDDLAKFRTVSMNQLRGDYIPYKMAKLIVDLQERHSPEHICRMTGIKEEGVTSLLELLEVPEVNFDDGATITSMDTARPIPVNIMLMPDEHESYHIAMVKAMALSGNKVVALVGGGEVGSYDKAMTGAFGVTGARLRNVGLATICKVFNAASDELIESVLEKVDVTNEL